MFWWKCSECSTTLTRSNMREESKRTNKGYSVVYFCTDCYNEKFLREWEAERQEMARENK